MKPSRSIALLLTLMAMGISCVTPDIHGLEGPSGCCARLAEAAPMVSVAVNDGAEYTMRVAPVKRRIGGQWVKQLGVNGALPGPALRVKQGATIRVKLENQTDIPLSLHPHGVRVDVANDGVVDAAHPAVAPGETRVYTLKFLDAGVYWYHSHVMEEYAQDMGYYGNFIVDPAAGGFFNPVDREELLLLDDIPIKDGVPFVKVQVSHTLMGRFGDVPLINGKDDFVLAVKQGEVLRLFLTNVANARPFAFAIPGLKLKLVGGDNGLFEHETWVDQLIIAPAERFIIEVKADRPGTFTFLNNNPNGRVVLGKMMVSPAPGGSPAHSIPTVPFDTLRKLSPAGPGFTDVRRHLLDKVKYELHVALAVDHSTLPMTAATHHVGRGPVQTKQPPERAIEWDDTMPAMNRNSNDRNVTWKLVEVATARENMAVKLKFKLGAFTKLRFVNSTDSMHPMPHPIHFHGQRFVVAAVNGVGSENLVWKDTVFVAPGETVDIVVEASNPGLWMAHCHIAEHLAAGMMIEFVVEH